MPRLCPVISPIISFSLFRLCFCPFSARTLKEGLWAVVNWASRLDGLRKIESHKRNEPRKIGPRGGMFRTDCNLQKHEETASYI